MFERDPRACLKDDLLAMNRSSLMLHSFDENARELLPKTCRKGRRILLEYR
jgi:hypothetical protein